MTEEEVSFDKDRCTKECLDVLTAYNMDHEGHPLIGKLHYEKWNMISGRARYCIT